jgi:peptidyl-prolyl cis-trans isomerase C
MHYSRVLLVALLLPALTACGPKAAPAPTGPNLNLGTGQTVATVNGFTIGQDFFDFYVKKGTGKAASELTAEQRGEVLDSLIRSTLLAQQALPKEGPLDGDTQQLLALVQLQVLEQVASDKKVPKPTDQELREAYEKALTGAPKMEYHARHILLATEAFAEKIVEKLDKGEKFEDLAKRESADAASKDSGGDLPWFSSASIDPALAEAVANLKPGAYTHTPVQSRFGWHVVKLIETRDAAPPPSFENVRPRLEQFLGQRKLKEYTDDLLRTAKIDKKGAAGAAASSQSGSAASSASSASSAKK